MSQGQVWVLLRGLGRDARHWGDFPQRLASATGSRVHCLDLPGNGARHLQASLPTVEAMADWCHAELARLDLDRTVAVCALSLGAMVAVAWASRHPGDLARAVLVNTILRPFHPPHWRMRPASFLGLLRHALQPGGGDRLEAEILRLTSRRCGASAEVLADWCRWRREQPAMLRNVLVQLRAAARYRAPAVAPTRRILLLSGGGDALVDPRCSQTLAQHWQLPLAVQREAGHDLPLDDPDWVLARIAEWERGGAVSPAPTPAAIP